MTDRSRLASTFRNLHRHGDGAILVLPNAWDAMSARVIEDAGAAAIATTSAGVSWALGRTDGEALSRAEMIEAVRRIVEAVRVPVTADVAETVRGVAEAGAVGINLEDGPGGNGAPLLEPAEHQAYAEAGADGVFVPGVVDAATIRRLVEAIGLPLNIMASSGAPPIAELATLGVARVSVGPSVARAAMAATRAAARELLGPGTRPFGAGHRDHPHRMDTARDLRSRREC